MGVVLLVILVGSDWGEVGCRVSRTAMKDGRHEFDIFPNNTRVGVGQLLDSPVT